MINYQTQVIAIYGLNKRQELINISLEPKESLNLSLTQVLDQKGARLETFTILRKWKSEQVPNNYYFLDRFYLNFKVNDKAITNPLQAKKQEEQKSKIEKKERGFIYFAILYILVFIVAFWFLNTFFY